MMLHNGVKLASNQPHSTAKPPHRFASLVFISSSISPSTMVRLGFRFDIAHRIIRFQLLFAIKIPQASSSPSSSLTHSIPNSSARSIRVFVFQFVIRNSIPINSSEEQSMYRRREALVVHLACARCG
ncbi:hypothetical protein Droror1_Dr00006709 [Drosera rotundifolia]